VAVVLIYFLIAYHGRGKKNQPATNLARQGNQT